jgi:hydrogenase maturation protease
MRSTLLVGIGNDFRRDDGVGLVVARALKSRNLPGATVVETSAAGVELLTMWGNADTVLLVDAVYSGAAPGSLHWIDLRTHPFPADLTVYSSHAFGLAKTLELARALDCLPLALVICGIEGKDFSLGEGLSPAVKSKLPAIIAAITEQLRSIFAP